MSRIRILNGPNRNQQYVLRGGEVCGRDPTCQIQIFSPGVSRRHFQFLVEPGGVIVADMGSANGTYVNNVRITRYNLAHADMVTVGGIQLQFFADDAAPVASGAAGGLDADGMFGAPTQMGVAPPVAPPPSGVVMREDDEEDSEVDFTLDASMVFSAGAVDTKGDTTVALKSLQQRMKIFYDVSSSLGSISEQAELLDMIMTKLFEAFPQCGRGFILLGDSIDDLKPAVIKTRDPADAEEDIPISRSIAGKVYGEKQAILSQNAMEDDRFVNEGGGGLSILNFQILSMMCAPLLFQDQPLGLVQLDTKDRVHKFTPDDLKLLTGISAQAAIFVKNMRLFDMVEKEASARTNMQRYFSPDLAEKVMAGEIDLKPGGDMKTGTVFFSDIIGFTAMSETLTPLEVITKINRYFKIMVDIIFKYHGYIDKFGGDAIMSVWGVPVAIRDESLLAVTAAVEMQNALYLFNRELTEEGHPDIQMGIGLNSGNFIAGNLGSERRMEYTVIGSNVNLAQRVESKAGRGNVFISPSVYERCGDGKLIVSALQPVMVKGIADPITIYSIRGVATQNEGVFLMTMSFCIDSLEGEEGLLVKAKIIDENKILALVLLPGPPAAQQLNLLFCPQEAENFNLPFTVNKEVPLPAKAGKCFSGVLDITGSMLHELIHKRVYNSDKNPDQLPRSKTIQKTT